MYALAQLAGGHAPEPGSGEGCFGDERTIPHPGGFTTSTVARVELSDPLSMRSVVDAVCPDGERSPSWSATPGEATLRSTCVLAETRHHDR